MGTWQRYCCTQCRESLWLRILSKSQPGLKAELPGVTGLSIQNLYYTKRFYLFYIEQDANFPQLVGNFKKQNFPQVAGESDAGICQQTAGKSDEANCPQAVGDFIFSIPWGHHRVIIDKFYEKGDVKAALFYLNKTLEDGLSRNVLKTVIESGLHLRQGKAITSFARLLPSPESELAQELTRDPYIFDFTEMT